MKFFIFPLFLGVVMPHHPVALANETPDDIQVSKLKMAEANYSNELAECASYFIVMADGSQKRGKIPESKELEGLAQKFASYSVMLSSEDAFDARFQLAMEEQAELVRSTGAYSPLVLKYKNTCDEAINNPKKRFNYWLNKS